MALSFPMLSCMTILGSVTAANPATGEASTQMDPTVPELDTRFANVGRRFDRNQVHEVLAWLVHLSCLPPSPKLARSGALPVLTRTVDPTGSVHASGKSIRGQTAARALVRARATKTLARWLLYSSDP